MNSHNGIGGTKIFTRSGPRHRRVSRKVQTSQKIIAFLSGNQIIDALVDLYEKLLL